MVLAIRVMVTLIIIRASRGLWSVERGLRETFEGANYTFIVHHWATKIIYALFAYILFNKKF